MRKSVYIIGSKGIPAKYGGFETFVEKLTEYQKNSNIQYYVACMRENSTKSGITDDQFEHNGAICFNIDVPNIGPARAIAYDIAAINKAIKLAKENKDEAPIFYILACRIGPFISEIKKKIRAIGGNLFVNPDGHEWLREKWSLPIRKYWKYSEKLMVKHADLLVCDSKNIEQYIQEDYKQYHPKTTYIAYGTDTTPSILKLEDAKVRNWYQEKGISENGYYLVVGRFVPENNYEAMIREFIKSQSKKDFVLITNVEQNKFYDKLLRETGFDQDPRIKFVGTVYDQELLKYIRENAFAYLHGHEVGGTNPSLLEALGSTKLNLLLDVGFNREVGEDGAIYWQKDELSRVIEYVETINQATIANLNFKSTQRILSDFTWEKIVADYEGVFCFAKS
ncbi:TPA: glycosyltransferase family 1 protein [Streptococcus pneumoniae]|uniref:Putative rhamnosyl transferase WchF n=1 Tax=Streptococcus pneumoniae TaxID=1313 RepID=Q4K2S4_STREE|nr:glycosyltransferase family 1 protein [Streptococcus pneumoniae]EJG83753.1 glycosyl transferases group 1 family protein [Streptococcus pneumoniae SPAR95]MBW5222209.1 glycosyltransferase family 1 protein [Streptococcus pneumoniae]MDG7304634.1 glycosyltransferase family 1 protein [Streptococcus pneumoniae]MDG7533019.1 glycosyltransferase family 1 protein [Streptococcus pneumoniae]MDG7647449.1 glycosyltransferase family 1 protein [Streptococcus pneumoniae]